MKLRIRLPDPKKTAEVDACCDQISAAVQGLREMTDEEKSKFLDDYPDFDRMANCLCRVEKRCRGRYKVFYADGTTESWTKREWEDEDDTNPDAGCWRYHDPDPEEYANYKFPKVKVKVKGGTSRKTPTRRMTT